MECIKVEEKNIRVSCLQVSASGQVGLGEGRKKPCFSELEVSLLTSCKKYGVPQKE